MIHVLCMYHSSLAKIPMVFTRLTAESSAESSARVESVSRDERVFLARLCLCARRVLRNMFFREPAAATPGRAAPMGSVEVLGVGSAFAAGAGSLAMHSPLAKLAAAPIAWASSCRRPRPRASQAVIRGGAIHADGRARHVRWCAPTPARGRGSFDSPDRTSTRAAAETSPRASRYDEESDEASDEASDDDEMLERVAVLVLAATGIPTRETKAALAARPELVRALADGKAEDDRTESALLATSEGAEDAEDETRLPTPSASRKALSEKKDRKSTEATFRAERRVAAALRFMTREVGFSAADAAGALRARNNDGFHALAADVDETSRRTFAFLRLSRAAGGAGLSAAAATRAAARDPRLLSEDVESIRVKFAWLADVAGVRPADAFATHAERNNGGTVGKGTKKGFVSSLVMLVRETDSVDENVENAGGADLRGAYEFLRVECCLGVVQTRATLRKHPHVLTKDVHKSMRPALATLRLNVSSDAAAKVIAKYPSVLTLLPETLAAKFFFLRETCGMDAERIEKLVSSSPSILTLSVERNLAPTFSFLKDELHLGESGARAVLAKAPSVFGLRRENVGPKFAFFAERAGRDAAVAIFAKAPSLLGTSLERNIAPTATWIVETCGIVGFGDGGGDENDERISVETKTWDPRAVDVLVSCPSLLGMSVERKLAPTLFFLSRHFPDAPAPILFRAGTFSLRGHVAPRVELLDETNLTNRWAPGTFLAWNVAAFCAKTGIDRDAYDEKVRECKARDDDWETGLVPTDVDVSFSHARLTNDAASDEARLGQKKRPGEDERNASASIRLAIRARAEASAPGRDNEPTPAERARARRAAKRRAGLGKEVT